MIKLLISVSLVTFFSGHVGSSSCIELHQSQLKLLNERMNQMIDTLSTLLPKRLKTSFPLVPKTPRRQVTRSITGPEINYYSPPQAYTNQPTSQIMYVPQTYPPVPNGAVVAPTWLPNPISTTGQAEYTFSPLGLPASYTPQYVDFTYQHEQPLQYANTMTSQNPPLSYPPGSYTLIKSPPEYTYPYLLENPSPAPTYNNIPGFASGLPLFPVPMQVPLGTYMTY